MDHPDLANPTLRYPGPGGPRESPGGLV